MAREISLERLQEEVIANRVEDYDLDTLIDTAIAYEFEEATKDPGRKFFVVARLPTTEGEQLYFEAGPFDTETEAGSYITVEQPDNAEIVFVDIPEDGELSGFYGAGRELKGG